MSRSHSFLGGQTAPYSTIAYMDGTSMNVGIGTTNPQQKLHVHGNEFVQGKVGINVANPLQPLHVVGTAAISDRLGIGKTDPSTTLDVAGDVKATGNVTIDGDMTVAGDLTVNGSTTIVNAEHLLLADNIISINANDKGSAYVPPNDLLSGIQVNRGAQEDFLFVFEEASDLFKCGTTTSLQAVATRPDVVQHNTIAVWNSNAKQYSFANDLVSVNGSVGIGTSNPTSKLHVVGQSALVGNVGINTTSPANTLHVNGTIQANAIAGTVVTNSITDTSVNKVASAKAVADLNTLVANNLTASTNLKVSKAGDTMTGKLTMENQVLVNKLDTNVTPGVAWADDMDTGLFHPALGTVAVTTEGTEKMRVNATGYVGIGTTNPSTMLHVNGEVTALGLKGPAISNSVSTVSDNIAASATAVKTSFDKAVDALNNAISANSNADTRLPMNGTGAMTGQLKVNAADTALAPGIVWSDDTDTGLWHPGPGTISISAEGLEKVRFTSNGNVGIGTTNPLTMLHVNGTIQGNGLTGSVITNNINVNSSTIAGSALAVKTAYDKGVEGVNKANAAQTSADAANANANTRLPLAGGTLTGDLTLNKQILANTADTALAPGIAWSGDTDTGLYHPLADTVAITTAGTESVRVTGTGNVGIGTTNPLNMLHVNGTIQGLGITGGCISDLVTSTSSTVAGSAKAVKTAYDKGVEGLNKANTAQTSADAANANANTRLPLAGGTLTGDLTLNKQLMANATDTALAPGIAWSADPDTGLYHPAADTVAITTAGTESVRVTGTGNVGIGTTNPLNTLHVNGTIQSIGLAGCISDVVNGTSSAVAGSAKAVKTAYDKGVEGVNKANTAQTSANNAQTSANAAQASADAAQVSADNANANANTRLPLAGGTLTGDLTLNKQVLANATDTVFVPGIAWSGDPDTGLYHPLADTVAVTTTGAERVRVAANGNVGIGTTNPVNMLHVNGTIQSTALAGCISDLVTSSSSTIAGSAKAVKTAYDKGIEGVNKANAAQTSANNAQTSADAAQVSADAANTNANTKLPLAGGTLTGDLTLNKQFLANTADTVLAPGIAWSGDPDTGLYHPLADTVAVTTVGAERVRFAANGNVGIGTTNPLSMLHVNGTIQSTALAGCISDAINSTSSTIAGSTKAVKTAYDKGVEGLNKANAAQTSADAANANANTRLLLAGGTLTGDLTLTKQLLANTGDTIAAPGIAWSGDPNSGLYHPLADTIAVTTAGTESVRFTSDGSVGIGTTNPIAKLDVNGPTNIYKGPLMMPGPGNGKMMNFSIQHNSNICTWHKLATTIETQQKGTFLIKGLWNQENSYGSFEILMSPNPLHTDIVANGVFTGKSWIWKNNNLGFILVSHGGIVHLYMKVVGTVINVNLDVTCSNKNFNTNNCKFYPNTNFVLTFDGIMTNVVDSSLPETGVQQFDFYTNPNTRIVHMSTNGNVGLGKLDPAATLAVNSTATSGDNTLFATNDMTIATISDEGGTAGALSLFNDGAKKVMMRSEGVSYLTGGNVGIGTNNPLNMLHVNGTIQGDALAGCISDMVNSSSSTVAGSAKAVKTAYDKGVEGLNSANAAQTSADAANTNANTKLPLAGGTLTGDLTLNKQFLANTADTVLAPGIAWSGDPDTGLYHPLADTVAVTTVGAERVRFAANGNVGIGTTNPLSMLHVNGTIQSTALAGCISDAINSTSSTIAGSAKAVKTAYDKGVEGLNSANAAQASANAAQASADAAQTTANTAQTSANNANANANTKLPLAGGTLTGDLTLNKQLLANTGDTVTAPGIAWSGDPNTGLYHPLADTVAVSTAGLERARFAANGNVGIGTTNPLNMLHVNGTIQSTALAGCISDVVNSTSSTIAGSAKAVKIAYDKGVEGLNSANAAQASANAAQASANAAQASANAAQASADAAQTTANTAQTSANNANTNANTKLPLAGGTLTGDLTLNKQLLANTGDTVTAPGIAWSGDPDTGLYHPLADTVAVTTVGAERVRFAANGNVGIGTTNPLSMLHVNGTIQGLGITGCISDAINSTSSTIAGSAKAVKTAYDKGVEGLNSANAANTNANTKLPLAGGTLTGDLTLTKQLLASTTDTVSLPGVAWSGDPNTGLFHPAADTVAVSTAGAERIRVDSVGNVGIGITAPTTKLHVDGQILATGDITAFSDARLKSDLQPITNALDKVQQLNGYTYKRTNDVLDVRRVGVLAQEVQQVLPEAVYEVHDGLLSVAYGNMGALFIEALKELKIENDLLKKRIEILENKI